MANYTYSDVFFDNVDRCATISAKEFVKDFDPGFPIKSILDVGCGRGAWLRVWAMEKQVESVGVDGDYVDTNNLLIDKKDFYQFNVEQPFDLNRKFDLVECLEVGEHVQESASKQLVENLIKHSDCILFSAALPGQGGTNHINEKDFSFWINIFKSYGYEAYDYPRIKSYDKMQMMPWYRYNMLLYVHTSAANKISEEVKKTKIQEGQNLYALLRFTWKIRLALIKRLPVQVSTWLSQVKYQVSRVLPI